MRGRLLAAVALAALSSAGCMTTGLAGGPTLGAPGYLYQGGRASQGFAYPMPQVQSALLEAMADLGIHSIRQTREAQLLIFEGRTVDDRRGTVTLESQNSLPVVTARFGWLGDEPLSRAFMDRVGIRLGSLPPEAIPTEAPSVPEEQSLFSRNKKRDPRMMPPEANPGYRDTPVP
jgi:hypothetical protein